MMADNSVDLIFSGLNVTQAVEKYYSYVLMIYLGFKAIRGRRYYDR